MKRIQRYIVINPGEEIPTSYDANFFGAANAEKWAKYNAKPRRGQVLRGYADLTTDVLVDYGTP